MSNFYELLTHFISSTADETGRILARTLTRQETVEHPSPPLPTEEATSVNIVVNIEASNNQKPITINVNIKIHHDITSNLPEPFWKREEKILFEIIWEYFLEPLH